jgi:hypothetical protein
MLSSEPSTIWRRPDPSRFITHMPDPGPHMKASCTPSGDQVGQASRSELLVRFRRFDPSAPIK